MGKAVAFFYEDTSFTLSDKKAKRQWIQEVVENENHTLVHINYIFCSDTYLLKINTDYLNHDFLTDIITFDQSTSEEEVEADIFISVDRVEENAKQQQVAFDHELSRVMVHGVLHLTGYDDKTPQEKNVMREKEDSCISLQK